MAATEPAPIRVTVWHEFVHEKKSDAVRNLYPDGMHAAIKEGLEEVLNGPGSTTPVEVRTATLEEEEHGLTQDVLDQTDVLTWWGHTAHKQVEDEIVERIQQRVLDGMGLIVMHSGHNSKIFKKLMGTGCGLKWREAAERERVWCVNPGHPIADGLEEYFELPHVEMYGELFDIPTPDELVFISWFEGGEVFRSGCCWTRGKGKVFYFRPGHETFPLYYDKHIRRVLANGVKHLCPAARGAGSPYSRGCPNVKTPLSPIHAAHEVDESLH